MDTNAEQIETSDIHNLICKRIIDYTYQTNTSYKQLGRDLGMDESYINKVLKGTLPSLDVLIKMCNCFHVSMKDFFDTEVEHVIEYSTVKNLLKKESKERIDAICLLLQNKSQ